MTEAGGEQQEGYAQALEAARMALERGDKATARRMARRAASLHPRAEAAWLYLAAASEPRAGLAYAARALEINPKSRTARKAIRWLVRRLPAPEQKAALKEERIPEDIGLRILPLDALSIRRWFSPAILLPTMILVGGMAIWLGGQPADARQPQLAPPLADKASLTPTPTDTPTLTPTPTETPTPTPTSTPTVTPTRTPRPDVSWQYSLDPNELAEEERWVDVDLGAQRVTAYEGANAVRTFVTSTGTWKHPTVTGQFRIYLKYLATPMAGPGYYLPGVPFTMYFYRGYSLHGTYWHDNFGTPMSHGCVNLRTPDAEWLYAFAPIGTLVNVHP